MNMGSHDRQGLMIRLLKSFSFAITGIKTAIWSERNMRIHLVISTFVIACSFFFSLTQAEWIFVILAIGGMISLELVNTALERVVNLITEEFHPLAKQAKDIAAGAVFVYAVMAVVIGILIFLPRIMSLF